MDSLPPLPRTKDDDHVQLLAVFSFVLVGISFLGLAFIYMHYLMMSTVFDNPEMWKKAMEKQKDQPPFDPSQFFKAFRYFYLLFAAWSGASIIANFISGFMLLKRRDWMFCLVVAGFNCVNFPFGSALGIFTIIVLLRDPVRARF